MGNPIVLVLTEMIEKTEGKWIDGNLIMVNLATVTSIRPFVIAGEEPALEIYYSASWERRVVKATVGGIAQIMADAGVKVVGRFEKSVADKLAAETPDLERWVMNGDK